MARFNAMYEEYLKNPVVTKQRMYYEAMEDVLPGMKIVVDSGNGVQKLLPLEPFSQLQAGGDSSESGGGEEQSSSAAQNTSTGEEEQ